MKRLIIPALILALGFSANACDVKTNGESDDDEITTTPATIPTDSPDLDDTIQSADETPPTQGGDITETPETPPAISLLIIDEIEPVEGSALLFLGMQKDEAWDTLLSCIGADDIEGGNEFYSSIDDGYHNTHEFKGFIYDTDKNDLLYLVSVNLNNYQPKSGLVFGDTMESVVELYGDDFTEYTEDESGYTKYEYAFGEHFFTVSFVDGTAYAWRVSSLGEQAFLDAFIDNIEPQEHLEVRLNV